MKIEQLYTGCLAEAAYYIESDGEVAIIDPLRETEPYLRKAKANGATIKYILETHFHADFVSGHLDLAKESGAAIVYGSKASPSFDCHLAEDGEVLKLGKVTLTVLHTPGHTPESVTYLLKDENGNNHAIFTGDTLFIGDVGRPDLAVKSDLTQEDLAGMLYDSLREKIMPLEDEVLVYPAHGAGSACGKNISKETFSTLGEQKKSNYALQNLSREAFIRELTSDILPAPQYFAKNASLNQKGYESFEVVLQRGNQPLTLEDFIRFRNEGALVLDVRKKEEFAEGHIPASVFIGIDGQFAVWVGALIADLKQPVILITPPGREEETVMRLSRVGYDNCLGFLSGGIDTWKNAGKPLEKITQISAEALREKIGNQESLHILDVRKPGEYQSGHVEGATSFPLDFFLSDLSQLNPTQPYYVHCKSGYRSMIAVSLMKARGFDTLTDVIGGYDALEKTGVPLLEKACSKS